MQTGDSAKAGFDASRERFEGVLEFLSGEAAASLTHGDLEDRLSVEGRELIRQLLQDHLDLRAHKEKRLDEVADTKGTPRRAVEAGHDRPLTTVFGEVKVERLAYRRRGHPNLHPADAALNLPQEKHSHGLRQLAAIESSRGSFDGAVEAIGRSTGQRLGKRQVEDLAQRAACDFDEFYAGRKPPLGAAGDVLILSCDGKGIVMRPDALRAATADAAAKATKKLQTRLSKGEKRNRKRMAEVGAVYDATPVARTPADILPADNARDVVHAPAATNKWLVASVTKDAASVVGQIFDEAARRDPGHERGWVALVDGNNHQIDRIQAEAQKREVTVAIVIDFIHVLEYLWKAAWCFFHEGDPGAERWVRDKAFAVLSGNATRVAGAIRRTATTHGLGKASREKADACANYLTNKRPFLDYPTALERGWPIATGVIEGACRHIVKDRMDLTGARWGLDGVDAVLKLRALMSNGDFADYWRYHLKQERQRVHQSCYADNVIPQAA